MKPAADGPLVEWALWYAGQGIHVFPCHQPVFDEAGSCTGCTCEAFRRSEECRHHYPHLYLGTDGHCKQPGKCPRVKWRDKSTTEHLLDGRLY